MALNSELMVSLDPGGTTGVAVFGIKGDAILIQATAQIGPQEHHDLLWDTLSRLQPALVVCEDFQYRNGLEKANLIPCQYIGVLNLWVKRSGAHVKMQTPATGKAFWTNDKLKVLGEYRAANPHAMDALRHGLHYISFTLGYQGYLSRLKVLA